MTSILDVLPTRAKVPAQVAKVPVKIAKKPTFANQTKANISKAAIAASEAPAKATKVEGPRKEQVKVKESAGKKCGATDVGGGRSLVEQLVELRRERGRLMEERSREQVRWGGGLFFGAARWIEGGGSGGGTRGGRGEAGQGPGEQVLGAGAGSPRPQGAAEAPLLQEGGGGRQGGGQFLLHPCLPQATLEVYQQMKDSYFGLVRQAGELDMEVRGTIITSITG